MKEAPTTDIFKLSFFPVKRNAIIARLENIGDNLDLNGQPETSGFVVNMIDVAQKAYQDANGDLSDLSYVDIQELSLSGNQPYSEMWSKKIKWQTVDDQAGKLEIALEDNYYGISLPKQRIRVFRIEYFLQEELPSFL